MYFCGEGDKVREFFSRESVPFKNVEGIKSEVFNFFIIIEFVEKVQIVAGNAGGSECRI